MDEPLDLYGALGVAPAATPGQIARAYRALVRRHHPDSRDRGEGAEHDRALAEAMAAYATLRDPHARAVYDRARSAHRAGDARATRGVRVEVVRRPARRPADRREPARDAAPVAGTTGAVPASEAGSARGTGAHPGPTITVGPVIHEPLRRGAPAGPGGQPPREADLRELLRALGF